MAISGRKCVTCGTPVIKNSGVWFPCPICGKVEIVRCNHCRCHSTKYICPECGFEGP